MPKVKVKKQSTFIDMTAMSDVTVLLLTFFMLTSTFIQKEPVVVSTPGSASDFKIPEINILQILVDPEGKIFMSLDKQEDRVAVLKEVGKQYGVQFTDAQVNTFRLSNSFGVPIKKMGQFLDLKSEQRDEVLKTLGIPCDSINNEFKAWVQQARQQVGKDLKIAIKADQGTPYKYIKNMMTSLQEIRENRYNLITTLRNVSEE